MTTRAEQHHDTQQTNQKHTKRKLEKKKVKVILLDIVSFVIHVRLPHPAFNWGNLLYSTKPPPTYRLLMFHSDIFHKSRSSVTLLHRPRLHLPSYLLPSSSLPPNTLSKPHFMTFDAIGAILMSFSAFLMLFCAFLMQFSAFLTPFCRET